MTETIDSTNTALTVVRPYEVWAEAGDYAVSTEQYQARHGEQIGRDIQFDDIVLKVSRLDGNADTVAICCDDAMWLDVLRRARRAIDHAEAALRQAGYVDDAKCLAEVSA